MLFEKKFVYFHIYLISGATVHGGETCLNEMNDLKFQTTAADSFKKAVVVAPVTATSALTIFLLFEKPKRKKNRKSHH